MNPPGCEKLRLVRGKSAFSNAIARGYSSIQFETRRPVLGLDGLREICKLHFSAMATQVNPLEDPNGDFQFPQREAAFFYGLFLRGHPAEQLKRDIAVPAAVLAKWDRESEREPRLRQILERVVRYRRHVLAIFENLVGHDSNTRRVQ